MCLFSCTSEDLTNDQEGVNESKVAEILQIGEQVGKMHSEGLSFILEDLKMYQKGLWAASAYLVFFTTFALIRFGSHKLFNEDAGTTFIFISIWTLIMFGVGYEAARRFYKQKELYFPYDTVVKNVKDPIKRDLWRMHKRLMVSKYLIIAAKLFAIVTPGYILAYLDDSEYLKSSIGMIIAFGAISLICFIAGKQLQKAPKNI